jgi:hypothetical protein
VQPIRLAAAAQGGSFSNISSVGPTSKNVLLTTRAASRSPGSVGEVIGASHRPLIDPALEYFQTANNALPQLVDLVDLLFHF